MLIKFLSFVVSVLGNDRYKTILASGTSLAIALASVTYAAAVKDTARPSDQATLASSQPDNTFITANSTQAYSTVKQQPNTVVPNIDPDTESHTAIDLPSKPEPAKPKQVEPANNGELVLTTSDASTKLTIAAGSTSSSITAATKDKSLVFWSVISNDERITIVTDAPENTAPSADYTFRIATTSDTPSGTYEIVVYAKDTNRGFGPATLSVIVP